MLRRVALVRIDVAEEHMATVIRVTACELGTLAATSNHGNSNGDAAFL
jgi:hypothetical protein